MASIRVKVCCIESLAEARMAVEVGASALGLVSQMPSGPGIISETEIGEIASNTPPFVVPVLLTSRTDAQTIAEQVRRCRVRAVQLCAPLDLRELGRLAELVPGIARIVVVHVTGPESVEEARRLESEAEGILLDTGIRSGPARQLGGTGRTHDWSISRRIVESVSCPVILAGGLRAANVAAAVREVRPWAVDVCSGVRTEGRLDRARLEAFLGSVRATDLGDPDRS